MPFTFLENSKIKAFLSNSPLFLIGGIVTAMGLFMPLGWFTNWYFSLSNFLVHAVCLIAVYFLFDKKIKLSFTLIDWVFLLFVIWHFLSFFWATNASLIWAKASAWLFLFCFYQIVKSLDFKQIKIEYYCRVFLLMNLFNYIVLSWFFFDISTGGDHLGFSFDDLNKISTYIGRNGNYVTSVLIVLFPFYFVVYHFLKKWGWLIVGMILVHLVFLFAFNSRGAVLALLVQLVVAAAFFFNTIKLKRILAISGSGLIILVLFSLLINNRTEFLKRYNPFFNAQTNYGDDRLDMWESSFKLFSESKLLGKGCGNWFLEYQKYGIGQFNAVFDHSGYFSHPHSQYLHILSELGLVGLLLYLFVIFYFLFLGIKHVRLTLGNIFYFAFLCMLLGYSITAFFYGVVYTTRYVFSFPQLALFFSFGIMSGGLVKTICNKKSTFLEFILVLFACLYLGFYYQYRKIQSGYNQFVSYEKKENYKTAIGILRRAYDPMFYTIMPHDNRLAVKAHEALALWEYGMQEKAIETMLAAHEDQPWCHENWFYLGNMYKEMEDWENAIICYENTYNLHDKFFEAQLNLVELNLTQNNMSEVQKWYDLVKSNLNSVMESYRKAAENPIQQYNDEILLKFKGYEERLQCIREDLKAKNGVDK